MRMSSCRRILCDNPANTSPPEPSMSKSKSKTTATDVDWPNCQLMLVIEPGPGARERLTAALQAADVQAVLIKPKPGDQLGAGEVKPLVDLAQDQGAAAILFEDADLAKTLRADGIHVAPGLSVRERVTAARAVLGTDASIGVDAGTSRHYAMEAGEAGADYVAFGAADGSTEARTQRDELIQWWAEIFEVPCVALDLADADAVERADHLGADFAALSLPAQMTVADVERLVADTGSRIADVVTE